MVINEIATSILFTQIRPQPNAPNADRPAVGAAGRPTPSAGHADPAATQEGYGMAGESFQACFVRPKSSKPQAQVFQAKARQASLKRPGGCGGPGGARRQWPAPLALTLQTRWFQALFIEFVHLATGHPWPRSSTSWGIRMNRRTRAFQFRLLNWFAAMGRMLDGLSEPERSELRKWENENIGPAKDLATSDWPGWRKYIGEETVYCDPIRAVFTRRYDRPDDAQDARQASL
jgi:hypothetical protein